MALDNSAGEPDLAFKFRVRFTSLRRPWQWLGAGGPKIVNFVHDFLDYRGSTLTAVSHDPTL